MLLTLVTNSKLVGCISGRSAGFASKSGRLQIGNSPAGSISELSRSSWGLQEASLQARNRIGARLVRSWQKPAKLFFVG